MWATWAWGAWWLAGLGVPLAQFHATSVEDSGWIALALWALAAGWLSLWTPERRKIGTGWIAALVAAWLVHPILVSWPALQRSEWIDAWGLVSRLSASGCLAFALAWGTRSVLRHSPLIGVTLQIALASLLSANLLFTSLQRQGVFSRWVWNEAADLGGILSSQTVASAWCAIAIPLLLGLKGAARLWAVPAILGILSGPRTATAVALAVWALWRWRSAFLSHPLASACVAFSVVLWWGLRVEGVSAIDAGIAPRLDTWPVILGGIASHPFGIGWHPMAYAEIARSSPHPIMGHPSSSFLAWTLAGGWALGASILAVLAWTMRDLGRSPLAGSLVVCLVFLCISRVIAQAQVGALAWALWCLWRIERSEDGYVA